MYDIMQQNYLWYQYMPGYDEVNLFQDPATFLSKAKWDKDSYSFVDSVLEGSVANLWIRLLARQESG